MGPVARHLQGQLMAIYPRQNDVGQQQVDCDVHIVEDP